VRHWGSAPLARVWNLVVFGADGPVTNRGDAQKKNKLSACRDEGSAAGLQLRVRFVPAALLAMLGAALALQCVSKAGDWTGHVDR
jgi:hypothetical protein